MSQNSSTKEARLGVKADPSVAITMVSPPPANTSDNSRSGKSVFVSDHQRVGKYQILAELGRGGAASVCLAVTRGKGDVRKLVVLKALLPELADEPGAVSAFLDEARLAAQLSHPNVVQTYEVGTESGRHVIVMEYLDGPSLSRVVRVSRRSETALPLAYHLHIISETLQGLHYAHEVKSYDGRPLKLVHRDVSPQNVIVTYDGQVKILDFGIAKAASSSTHTATGIMKGKIAYMAPEQMAGIVIDRRADIYSAGCMLWAAATGQKLWQDVSDVQIVRSVVAGRIPSPKTINKDCPDELEQIIMRAMQPDPERRYSSALEMQTEIEQFCEKRGYSVKQRDMGRLVSELFADSRAEFNENLERELSAVLASDSLSGNRDTVVDTSEDLSFSGIPTRVTSASGSAVVSGVKSSEKVAVNATMRRSVVIGGALASVLLLLGIVLWYSKIPDQPLSTASTTTTPVSVAKPVVNPSPAPITNDAVMRLAVTPTNATVMLDGRVLPAGTQSVVLPVGEATHELTVDAEGYVRQVQSFKVFGPTTLTFSLATKPEAKKSVRGRGRTAGISAVPAAVPSATKPQVTSCENPFFVDAQGIKRVRPNCL